MPRDRTGEEAEERKAPVKGKGFPRCSWKTGGRQCYMLGCISPDIGDNCRWYCQWHYVSLSRPKWSQDFEEFCRWNAGWAGYCSPENHYPDPVLWDAITGIAPFRGPVKSCGLPWCRHVASGRAEEPDAVPF